LNREGILQGRLDEPILEPDPETRRAIASNGELLARLGPFDAVFASTLRRTQQTAEAYGYRPDIDPLLDELDFGPYEGQPREQLLREVPEWTSRPESVELGESIAELEERVRRFLERHASLERVLIFGHGAWLRALRALALQGDIHSMNTTVLRNNTLLELEL
jgi:broad specificity phosphatase PhoE